MMGDAGTYFGVPSSFVYSALNRSSEILTSSSANSYPYSRETHVYVRIGRIIVGHGASIKRCDENEWRTLS